MSEKVATAIITFFVLLAFSVTLIPWVVMLLLGGLSHQVSYLKPLAEFGFWESVLLVLTCNFLFKSHGNTKSEAK